ncbi:hypothetical protein KQI84_08945 [bacterium]|nr:hypothetical protein [bacterium]
MSTLYPFNFRRDDDLPSQASQPSEPVRYSEIEPMSEDSAQRRQDAEEGGEWPVWKKHVIRGALALLGVGVVVALIIPAFLKPRSMSVRDSCQENVGWIHSAVQQYMKDHDLKDWSEAVRILGTDREDWEKHLVGVDSYIRYPRKCPCGGEYTLNPEPTWPPVFCSYHTGEKAYSPPSDWGGS